MKKQKVQLLLLLILLIVCAAAYLFLRSCNRSHPEGEEEEQGYPVTREETAKVTAFAFTNENGSFHFNKKEDQWVCEEEPEASIDTVSLEDMIQAAVTVTGKDRIEEAEDLSQYGLTKPSLTVSFTTKDGSTSLCLGDYNSAVSMYYLCLQGENTVYTVDSTVKSAFSKELDDLKVIQTEQSAEE